MKICGICPGIYSRATESPITIQGFCILSVERRKHPRRSHWFDGNWQGASGAGRCRVSDISISGCFVHSLASPQPGERTIVRITTGAGEMSIDSEVVYIERTMGFGVKFGELSTAQRDTLQLLIDSAQKASA